MNSMSDTEIVQHVLRHRADYYRILMIERTVTEQQVKVAYKKMALKCHPDKNTHPQSADAFKLVGAANATLSDSTKRRIYDRQGMAGVQRHESGGSASAAARNGNPYRRQAQTPADAFEEFFFGTNSFFHQQRQTPHPQQQQQRRHAQNNAQYELNIDPNLLMMIPVIIFIILALLLQSSMTDIGTDGSSSSYNGFRGGDHHRSNSGAVPFSLTPAAEEGLVLKRTTSLQGLRVAFYTSRRWSDVLDRRRDVLLTTEREVLKSQRDYLGNRCEAETFKHRTRGRTDAPEACTEYHRLRRALG